MIPLKDENPTHRTPFATVAIILACIGVYFLWQPTPFSETAEDVEFAVHQAAIPCEVVEGRPLTIEEIEATYGQMGRDDACGVGSPDSPSFDEGKSVWWSVIVSMFLHGSLLHLGGNVLFLWVFGNNIEDHLGAARFVLFYLVGGVAATAAHVLLDMDSTIAVIGASGAIAAVMGAYLVWFPDAPVRTLLVFVFIVMVHVRAKWLLGFWFVLQFFTSPASGVAWAAHVGGFVFGVAVGLVVRALRPARAVLWANDHRDDEWDPTGGAGYRWYERD